MSRRARLRKIKRIRSIVVIGTVMFVLMVGIMSFTTKTASADNADHARYKYYTSITVQNGDTLWSIADEHRTEEYATIDSYISEVRKLNHLSGSKIISGSVLVIPYYSDEYKL